jgi:hypothetical protein
MRVYALIIHDLLGGELLIAEVLRTVLLRVSRICPQV